MTPQSELTRLLGIPQELWAEELRGMSERELDALHDRAIQGMTPFRALLRAIDKEEAGRKNDQN